VQLSKNFRKKISRLEHYYESLYYHSVKLKKTETIGKVKDLTEDVKELVKNNQMDDAERKCLLAISLDPQNPDLYEMLTHIYWDKKDYDNAIGTISYLIELRKRLTAGKNNGTSNDEANHTTALLAAHYLELGLIYQDAHKSTNAIEAFQNALVLQPNHPRYLGLLLDASIESKNKEASIKNLEALRMVNPENEKIASYQALIDNIKNN
jgi:tetratricopeptide (TPR) repeat protein